MAWASDLIPISSFILFLYFVWTSTPTWIFTASCHHSNIDNKLTSCWMKTHQTYLIYHQKKYHSSQFHVLNFSSSNPTHLRFSETPLQRIKRHKLMIRKKMFFFRRLHRKFHQARPRQLFCVHSTVSRTVCWLCVRHDYNFHSTTCSVWCKNTLCKWNQKKPKTLSCDTCCPFCLIRVNKKVHHIEWERERNGEKVWRKQFPIWSNVTMRLNTNEMKYIVDSARVIANTVKTGILSKRKKICL